MRSFLLIAGLALVVGATLLSGYLPSRAGATGGPPKADSKTASGIEFEYADFEAEEPLVLQPRPARDEPPAPPKDEPASAPQPARADDQPAKAEPVAVEEHSYADWPQPVADAGQDQTVWVGDAQLQLDGSASTGDALIYSWRQVAGPNELQLREPSAARTTASGFPLDWTPAKKVAYEFELTVTDVHGQQATGTVRYAVKATPTLAVTPPPRRYLAERDGYLLAHFEAWKTNRSEYADTFEVRSPAELTFHQLSGTGEFEITVSHTRSEFVYVVSVFYREGEPATWLEFFVDTPERIPAILQLGVNWE